MRDAKAAEETAVRIRPVRQVAGLSLPALGSRSLAAAILLLGAAFLGATWWVLRESEPLSRDRMDFPAPLGLDAAIAGAQEKLKGDPQDIEALVELGMLHFKKGPESYPEAINELEQARELGALDPRVFYGLGIMYQEVGLYPFALQEYRRFLRHYPEDREVRLLQAKLLYQRGRHQEAVAEYERLKFHHPNDGLIEENLALALWGAKETVRASESLELLRAQGGELSKRAEFYLGQIRLEEGKAEAALGHFLKCSDQASFGIPPERVHSAAASALQKLGRLEEAKGRLEQALAASPGDAKILAALREIKGRLPKKKAKTGK